LAKTQIDSDKLLVVSSQQDAIRQGRIGTGAPVQNRYPTCRKKALRRGRCGNELAGLPQDQQVILRQKDGASTEAIFAPDDLARRQSDTAQAWSTLLPTVKSVKEVVMMGRYPHIPRFSAPSAEDADIVQEIMEKTEVSEFGGRFITELSGGERQRVVFARALAQDTHVLILDEATSNLDINHSISLLNISAGRMKQKEMTIISVMQDINLAAVYCDYLVFMSKGRIAIHGATQDVLNSDTIRKVFHIDAKVYTESYSNSLQVVFKK